MVLAKGPEDYAIDAVGKEIEQSGLIKMSIKSDQEPVLVDVIRAVKRERGESIEVMKPEHSPVGESQSNGRVERTIRTVQAQVRTLKLMVESKYKTVVDQESAILPWLVKYAATLINIASVGKDGRTPFERRSGRKWKKALPTFGECIWWMRPDSKGEQKLETRWENGVYLGVRTDSGEIIVGNQEGVVKVRTFAVRPQGQQWILEELEQLKGTPWEPIPGKGRIELKSRVNIATDVDGNELKEPEARKEQVRRLKIRREDIMKYGITLGCPGCRAVNRGVKGVNHNEKCRARMEKEISTSEPERMDAAVARMLEKELRRGEEEEGAAKLEGGVAPNPTTEEKAEEETLQHNEEEEKPTPEEVMEMKEKVESKIRRDVGETRGGVELFVDVAKANPKEMEAIEWILREERSNLLS